MQSARSEWNTAAGDSDKQKAKQKIDSLDVRAKESESKADDARIKLQQAQDKAMGRTRGESTEDIAGGSWWDELPSLRSFLIGVCALLVLVGLGYAAKFSSDRNRRREARFMSLMKRQEELARQTKDSVSTLSQEVQARLAALQAALGELRGSLQDDNRAILDSVRRISAATTSPKQGAYQFYTTPEANIVSNEPAFPTSVEDYLVKVKRGAIIVKPDFQNDILIHDADNSGEFMLVRDNVVSDEPLYVIPKVSYFQTKQDFYNYYDKYYNCQHPSAGTIWIVQPAVVDRVGGGWALREKGELEVR